MGKKDKLVKRLLHYFDFEIESSGKTSGSSVKFKNVKTGVRIYLHKPHPGNIVKRYILRDVIEVLKGSVK